MSKISQCPSRNRLKSVWALSSVSNPEMRIFVQGQGNQGLCGDVAGYVAQTNAPIDAEIGQKDHLWMETSYGHDLYSQLLCCCTSTPYANNN